MAYGARQGLKQCKPGVRLHLHERLNAQSTRWG